MHYKLSGILLLITPQNVHLMFFDRFVQIVDECDNTQSLFSTIYATTFHAHFPFNCPTARVFDFVNNDVGHNSETKFS